MKRHLFFQRGLRQRLHLQHFGLGRRLVRGHEDHAFPQRVPVVHCDVQLPEVHPSVVSWVPVYVIRGGFPPTGKV